MTDYLVKPENSTTWHHVKPCIAPARFKEESGHHPPILHYANFEGAIICSALDDHELIMVQAGGEIIRHHTISAREHFQALFDAEELEAANA